MDVKALCTNILNDEGLQVLQETLDKKQHKNVATNVIVTLMSLNLMHRKCDAFCFHIVNFPFMSSNIPSAPAYGVYASQLIHYARCCSNYSDFLLHHRAIVTRLLSQGYKVNRLSNTFKKFYGRHKDLVGQYKKNVCQMFADSISWNDFYFWCICRWPN